MKWLHRYKYRNKIKLFPYRFFLQLGALLKTVVNSADDFSPESSLFIGNKWENIPPTDKVAVKDDIFQKLNKVYPGITEEQVHYMSVTKV